MRHENDDLGGLELPDPDIMEKTYYTEDGQILNNSAWSKLTLKPTVCALIIKNPSTKAVAYYVRYGNSKLYNPYEKDPGYRRQTRWELRKVGEPCFNSYISFIDTKRKVYLFQAERNI